MSHVSRILKVVIVAVGVGVALVACGMGPTIEPSPDAGALPECPAGPPAFCTAAGVCTVDGMQCLAPPHPGFPHPDAGVDAP